MSIVAETQKAIELEEQASRRVLNDYAAVARHEVITRKMEDMTHHLQELEEAGKTEELLETLLDDNLWGAICKE